MTIDLKDASFHIGIRPEHWKFLRFAFRGKAYQYCVLPFGLALSPCAFMKYMDAALASSPGHLSTELPGRLARPHPVEGLGSQTPECCACPYEVSKLQVEPREVYFSFSENHLLFLGKFLSGKISYFMCEGRFYTPAPRCGRSGSGP